MGGPQQQSEYSDWWGQVGLIGGGGLLPVHLDSVTAGGLAHLPSGNGPPVCTAGAFSILCLTTEVTTAL